MWPPAADDHRGADLAAPTPRTPGSAALSLGAGSDPLASRAARLAGALDSAQASLREALLCAAAQRWQPAGEEAGGALPAAAARRALPPRRARPPWDDSPVARELQRAPRLRDLAPPARRQAAPRGRATALLLQEVRAGQLRLAPAPSPRARSPRRPAAPRAAPRRLPPAPATAAEPDFDWWEAASSCWGECAPPLSPSDVDAAAEAICSDLLRQEVAAAFAEGV